MNCSRFGEKQFYFIFAVLYTFNSYTTNVCMVYTVQCPLLTHPFLMHVKVLVHKINSDTQTHAYNLFEWLVANGITIAFDGQRQNK